MMTLERAREIWKYYQMSEEDLKEWVWTFNNRGPDPPGVFKGETIDIHTTSAAPLFPQYQHTVPQPPELPPLESLEGSQTQ